MILFFLNIELIQEINRVVSTVCYMTLDDIVLYSIQVGPEVFLKKTLSRTLRVRVKSDKITKSPHRNQGFLRSHRFRTLITF